MSFVQRAIDVTIVLAVDAMGNEVGSTTTLTGLRVQAAISAQIGDAQSGCVLRIFGLPLKLINQLTCIGPIATQIRNKNSVLVAAGEEGGAMTTVYEGTIDEAYGEFQSAPDCTLNISSIAALDYAVTPVGATSFKGVVPVVTVIEQLATLTSLTVQNNGVTGQLSNPYFAGTALTQIQSACRGANIDYVIDRGVIHIFPKGGNRVGDIPLLNRNTGLVGYPIFSSDGISFKAEFNPNFSAGGQVQVESELTAANGLWTIVQTQFDLASQMPGGAWFSQIKCRNPLSL